MQTHGLVLPVTENPDDFRDVPGIRTYDLAEAVAALQDEAAAGSNT